MLFRILFYLKNNVLKCCTLDGKMHLSSQIDFKELSYLLYYLQESSFSYVPTISGDAPKPSEKMSQEKIAGMSISQYCLFSQCRKVFRFTGCILCMNKYACYNVLWLNNNFFFRHIANFVLVYFNIRYVLA